MPLFQNRDAEYIAWLDTNPDGYAINTYQEPSGSYMVLHSASCAWARQPNPTSTQYSKFGCATLEEAQGIAVDLGGELKLCGKCNPTARSV
jgi:hypothetical protein